MRRFQELRLRPLSIRAQKIPQQSLRKLRKTIIEFEPLPRRRPNLCCGGTAPNEGTEASVMATQMADIAAFKIVGFAGAPLPS